MYLIQKDQATEAKTAPNPKQLKVENLRESIGEKADAIFPEFLSI